jgi:hypothetical protein
MPSSKYDLYELKEIRKQWSDIPIDALPEDKRKAYISSKNAIDMYIDGCRLRDIEERTGVKSPNISRLVEKCIEVDENGSYLGYKAILIRRSRNNSGKFSDLLINHPELKDFIAGCWYGDKKYTTEKNMNCITLHRKFLKKCLEVGVSDYDYPFNTANLGYVSLCNYIKSLDKDNITDAAKRESRDNMQKLMSTGIGERYTSNSLYPFSTVQIDGHIIDLMYNVEIVNEDGTIDKRTATRAWVIAVIDVATRCILGYSLSQEFNYNQFDVIEALQNSVMPKTSPATTIDGLRYPENGGYYQTAFPELTYALFDSIMLDNAKSHLAENTLQKMVVQLQCSVNYGSVATPETRGIVERFFGSLETRGFHKLPSTTGSSIRDLKRRSPEKAAVVYNISFDEITQLIDVLIAEYNNTPHSGISNLTPLECMRRRVFESGMLPTIADDRMIEVIKKLNYLTITRVVKGGKNGKRAYINYEGAEYRSSELSSTGYYIGKTISILVNPRDISSVEAYAENGSFIGILTARGEFGTKSHSLKTRKNANKYARERGRSKVLFDPAITAYEEVLKKRGKTNRRDATKADIVSREIKSMKTDKQKDKTETTDVSAPVVSINGWDDMLKISDPEEFYRAVWGNRK